MDKLGEHLMIAGFAVKGKLSEEVCKDLTPKILSKIGVTPAHRPCVFQYPLEGKGGNGLTYFQPFTESFLAWDMWPDLGGAYLIICSCKAFWIIDVLKVLRDAGFEVVQKVTEGLSFDDLCMEGI